MSSATQTDPSRQPRAHVKDELRGPLAFLEDVLRTESGLAAEYPLVFRPGFPGRVAAIEDQERVHSACTLLRRDLVVGRRQLPVGLIGSVATHEEHRGQGLATKVLFAAEEELRASGALLSLLWADDPRFYFARGYRPVGAEDDILLSPDLRERLPEAEGVRTAQPADAAGIHALYEAHPARLARSEAETAALLDCPRMEVLVREDANGICAYSCLGRGYDLHQTVHEWGGSTEDVLALLRRHMDRRLETGTVGDLFLMAPAGRDDLREHLTGLGAACERGILGLGKVLDRGGLAALLNDLLPDAEVRFDAQAEEACQVELVASQGRGFLSDDTLLVLLFSAKGERADIDELGESLGFDASALPLEAFVWGLDSI